MDILNGVNTWDLILISRHILNLEPFNTPYKIIAADSDSSGTISSFDIVLLRKLILGTLYNLPGNSSWRFVDANHVFSNPANPFLDTLALRGSISNVVSGTHQVDFIGIKVGDVDHNAISSNKIAVQKSVPFSWQPAARQGKSPYITVPVVYQGTEPLEALQLGFRFDPDKVELIGPSQGSIEGISADNFGLTRLAQGYITALWYHIPTQGEGPLQQGDVLFYLTFKTKTGVSEQDMSWFGFDNQALEGMAWSPEGEPFGLTQTSETAYRSTPLTRNIPVGLSVQASPNPTSGAAFLFVNSPVTISKARLGLFDAFGKVIFVKNVVLEEGIRQFDLPEMAQQIPGVYGWKIWSPDFVVSGQIVKQ